MIFLIGGASHTGKTVLAQKLVEKYKIPYLSLDHLKMGLIRSGQTALTPEDDDLLTAYLWPIAREMIRTCLENGQSLIVEGCYIPFDWKKDFDKEELKKIQCLFLVMTPDYVKKHFDKIKEFACVAEDRLDDSDCTPDGLLRDNEKMRAGCEEFDLPMRIIEDEYPKSIPL